MSRRIDYYDDPAAPKANSMVPSVNVVVVNSVIAVFRTLYLEHFPIMEMVPEDDYGGNDNLAAAADDTSGFNCRDAVTPGPPLPAPPSARSGTCRPRFLGPSLTPSAAEGIRPSRSAAPGDRLTSASPAFPAA